MTDDQSKEQLGRDYTVAFRDRDEAWWDVHIAPDFVRHDPGLPFEVRGRAGPRRRRISGTPASGLRIDAAVMDLFRIADGKLVEHWALMDNLTMLKQIGAVPA